MKAELVSYLACPSCGGDLTLEARGRDGIEIVTGDLTATCCKKRYPIVRGVPRFVDAGSLGEGKAETASNFGWQWLHFTQEDERYAEQFLGWIGPVKPEFFAGKVVVEGGCGKGRHTRLAARWGAKDIVAVDLSDAVESAFEATKGQPNVHIVQADIYALPLKRVFDYAFSVGVLHHLPDPKRGFESLASKVKTGGHISAWVYGAENNEWITGFVSPLREKITSRIDRNALLHLSKIPTLALYAATKLVYGPVNAGPLREKVAPHLFYNDYLAHLAGFGWREQHTIVFDHLVAPTAFYISRPEFDGWWRDIGAADVDVSWYNQNSWRGFGRITEKSARG